MCNLQRINHKLNIKPFGLYLTGVYTSIKSTKIKIHSYNNADGMADSVDRDQTTPLDRDLHCLSRPVCRKTYDHYSTQMSPVKRICVFEHSVMTSFNCACPAIQRGQGSGFLSEDSS